MRAPLSFLGASILVVQTQDAYLLQFKSYSSFFLANSTWTYCSGIGVSNICISSGGNIAPSTGNRKFDIFKLSEKAHNLKHKCCIIHCYDSLQFRFQQ